MFFSRYLFDYLPVNEFKESGVIFGSRDEFLDSEIECRRSCDTDIMLSPTCLFDYNLFGAIKNGEFGTPVIV